MGTDNQTTRRTGCTHSGAHWGTANCTYKRAQTTSQTGATQCGSEGMDNQSVKGTLGQSTVHTEGTDNHTDRGTEKGAHWGTANSTYRGYRQPVKQGPTGPLSTVHTDGTGNQPGKGRGGLGTDGTNNQTDRGHTQWGTLG